MRDFRRAALTVALLAVPFGLASCNKNDAKPHKTRAEHHETHRETHPRKQKEPPAAPKVDLGAAAANSPAVGAAAAKTTPAVAKKTPPPPPASPDDLCFYGCPTGAPANDIVVDHVRYILDYNPETKMADVVVYRITSETVCGTGKRTWHRDPQLPKDISLSSGDYDGIEALGMERGHQAPLGSLSCGGTKSELDNLDNITPQAKDLNEGPWEMLERRERAAGNDVRSATGPLFEEDMPQLPNAALPHKIPSGYWKEIAVRQGDDLLTATFIFSQKAGREDDICAAAVPMITVETRRHIQFFPQMEPDKRQALETKRGDLLPLLGCK